MSNRHDATISVIIPVYRDNEALLRLLQQLTALRSELLEIMVVDGASDTLCRELCATAAAHWLTAEPCRGAQLRNGADYARGAILWFLHADAQLPPQCVESIRAAMKSPAAVGGHFRFALQGRTTLATRLFTMLVNWRTLWGIPYGDQGIFVRAAAYRQVDGHRAIPLFEEVRLIRRLRKLGGVIRLSAALAIDPRRYRRDGWLRRSLTNRLLALGYGLGIDPFRLAAWYGSRTTAATQRGSACTMK